MSTEQMEYFAVKVGLSVVIFNEWYLCFLCFWLSFCLWFGVSVVQLWIVYESDESIIILANPFN